jgi:hypothetical protein
VKLLWPCSEKIWTVKLKRDPLDTVVLKVYILHFYPYRIRHLEIYKHMDDALTAP